jgi:hypothetical protein
VEKKPKEKIYWPVFLPGIVLGLITGSFYFLQRRISGEWFGGLCLLMAIALLIYFIIGARLRARVLKKVGRWKKYTFGAAVGIAVIWELTEASLGSSNFFRYLEEVLDNSGWIWIVVGIAIILVAWSLSLHPVEEEFPTAGKTDPPPWEG